MLCYNIKGDNIVKILMDEDKTFIIHANGAFSTYTCPELIHDIAQDIDSGNLVILQDTDPLETENDWC